MVGFVSFRSRSLLLSHLRELWVLVEIFYLCHKVNISQIKPKLELRGKDKLVILPYVSNEFTILKRDLLPWNIKLTSE